jgi:transcriptional regulator with XRE-family HTH domain
LRESKNLSQGDIENRSGLKRCYVSRVENGHTVPAVETLEKMARALEVPLYRLFYDGTAPLKLPALPNGYASKGNARQVAIFADLFEDMGKRDRELLLHMARRMAMKKRMPRKKARGRRSQ